MDPKQLRDIIKEELKPVIEAQVEHSKLLNEHSGLLKGHSKLLNEHSGLLKGHSKLLNEHSDKLDAITAELHQVHKLADTTLDVVKGRYEKNKREIDEIKDHLRLPKESYFGE